MSGKSVPVECVTTPAAAPAPTPDDETDPLAWEEGEGQEVDPLADLKTLKAESGSEKDKTDAILIESAEKSELTEDDLLKSDEDTTDILINHIQKKPTEASVTPKPIAQEPTVKPIEADTKPPVQKASTEQNKSPKVKCVEEKPMEVVTDSNPPTDAETNGTAEKKETASDQEKSEFQKLNGDHKKAEPARKRSSDQPEQSVETPSKKLRQEVEKSFVHHDNMINDYIQTTTKNNVDEIQRHTDQLISEIQTLRELAQKKEHEWNNILHLKKVKEEILLRLLRRKQVLSFEKAAEVNGSDGKEPFDFANQSKNLTIDKSDDVSGLAIKQPGSSLNQMTSMPAITHYNPISIPPPPPYDKQSPMHLPKPMFPQHIVMPGPRPGFGMDMNGQFQHEYNMQMGHRGPVKDVKSIIADYRQRHPESTPRRGRRAKSILNPHVPQNPRALAPKMENMNNLGMILNSMDMNQKSLLERLSQVQGGTLPNGISFKDVLVQFANMQQQQNAVGLLATRPQMDGMLANRQPESGVPRPQNNPLMKSAEQKQRSESPRAKSEVKADGKQGLPLPPPPPYPEISLLPVVSSSNCGEPAVQSSSLLHGILTKQASSATQTFSPTLAKLLTSPERKQQATSYVQAKNCGEITITPVQPKSCATQESSAEQTAPEEVVQLDDEDSGRSEGEAEGGEAGEGSSGEGGSRLVIDEAVTSDVPLCQGCRRRDAQFVCAGCANQWYCSRDCQVSAWDDHSEMCSG